MPKTDHPSPAGMPAPSCCCLCNRPVPLSSGELALLLQASRHRLQGDALGPEQTTDARALKHLGYLSKSTRGGHWVMEITERGRQRLALDPCLCAQEDQPRNDGDCRNAAAMSS